MMLSPFYRYLGPAWFRRLLTYVVPDPYFQRLKTLADAVDASSRNIFETKKAALLRGEESVKAQMNHGKDIMSILCVYH